MYSDARGVEYAARPWVVSSPQKVKHAKGEVGKGRETAETERGSAADGDSDTDSIGSEEIHSWDAEAGAADDAASEEARLTAQAHAKLSAEARASAGALTPCYVGARNLPKPLPSIAAERFAQQDIERAAARPEVGGLGDPYA